MSSQSYDPIAQLRANAEQGRCSRITYNKGAGHETERTIEPRGLIESSSGMLIRVLQHGPTQGIRHLSAERIVKVESCETPAVPGEEIFSADDVMVVRRSRPLDKNWTDPTLEPAFVEYLTAVRDAVTDLTVEHWEAERIQEIRTKRRLAGSTCRAAHALVYAEYLLAYANDATLDEPEESHLAQLAACLEELGWRPV